MPRHLLLLLVLSGCSTDSETRCMSADCAVTISVVTEYIDLDPATEEIVALGGTVDLAVDDGGAEGAELVVEVTGGELVTQAGRQLRVRALEETVRVYVEVGGQHDDILIAARPLETIELMPVEHQFRQGPPPLEFSLVRDAFLSVAIHLTGAETRLVDSSLLTTGASVGPDAFGDLLVVNGTIDPVAFTVAGDSGEADFEIPFAAAIESIEVVSAPLLSDPEQPITLGDDRMARVCFTAMAAGLQVAGLEWTIAGPGLESDGACAFVREDAATLSVSAGGITRTFDLVLVDP
jgi:hypothetical protein